MKKEKDTYNLRLKGVAEILQTKNSQIYRTNEKIDVYEEVYKDFNCYKISLE